MCSHLFWFTGSEKQYQDSNRVFSCLLKASKIADSAVDTDDNIGLFVEILNVYLHFLDNPDATTIKRINQLITHIKSNYLESEEQRAKNDSVLHHFRNTMQHINLKKQAKDARYEGIEVVSV